MVTRCRHFRNRLLGEDTRRRKSYELMRDILKGAILLETRKSRVGFRDMPYLADRLFQALRTEGLDGAARLIKNRIDVGYEYPQWIERYDTLSSGDRAAIKRDSEALKYKPLISVLMCSIIGEQFADRLPVGRTRRKMFAMRSEGRLSPILIASG